MIESWKVVLIVAGVVVLAVLSTALYHHWLSGKVDKTMEQVDDTINSLITHHEQHYFSEAEDSLLGKFQHEIMQLHDMLCSYEEQEKLLRGELNSSISDLVHQINTPITNIKMYSNFLLDEDLDASKRELFICNIQKQAEKLSWLGEGFAKLSRLETGIIRLQPEYQEILPVLLRAIDQVTLNAQQHGNDVRLTGDNKLQAYFDGKWMEEVFYNLLDNAVKYSDAGSAITVEMLKYELYARINIVNDGIKIAVDEYAKVFQRFYRGKAVKDQDGVGLGLYLAREIVGGQQGYIKVEKGLDGATVFSVFLLNSDLKPEK